VLGRLDDLEARHGVHRTCQLSRRLRTAEAAGAAMAALRAAPPSSGVVSMRMVAQRASDQSVGSGIAALRIFVLFHNLLEANERYRPEVVQHVTHRL